MTETLIRCPACAAMFRVPGDQVTGVTSFQCGRCAEVFTPEAGTLVFAETSEPAAAAPVNPQELGALGPPPPYRPAGQPAAGFSRGQAPDLEALRAEALARLASSRANATRERATATRPNSEMDRWVVPRDSERPSEPEPASRPETGPSGTPVPWPYPDEPPPPPPFGPKTRAAWRGMAVWGGIAAAMALAAGGAWWLFR